MLMSVCEPWRLLAISDIDEMPVEVDCNDGLTRLTTSASGDGRRLRAGLLVVATLARVVLDPVLDALDSPSVEEVALGSCCNEWPNASS